MAVKKLDEEYGEELIIFTPPEDTKCPNCGKKITVKAGNDGFYVNGEHTTDQDEEIFYMPCCNHEAVIREE